MKVTSPLPPATSLAVAITFLVSGCADPSAMARPSQGVLNIEPGTSVDAARIRIASEICPGASSITITSGPEPALDPSKEQVTFECTP